MKIIESLNKIPLFIRALITFVSFIALGYLNAKINKEMPDISLIIFLFFVVTVFTYGFISIVNDVKKHGFGYVIRKLLGKEE